MKLPTSWQTLRKQEQRTVRTRTRIARAVEQHIEVLADGHESARVAGLRYVDWRKVEGIGRLGSPKRFRYVGPHGARVSESDVARIRSLVIPPAWTEVWICPYANGHLQATGRDARGRVQYRYHSMWRAVRDEVKYGRMLAFAEALPRIRQQTARDLEKQGLPREKVLAAVVQLLEKTLIRVGNEEYARDNGSVGLTTMRVRHAKLVGGAVRFVFRGKSGVAHEISLTDRRLARVVAACRDLPGQDLFQYVDENGETHAIGSSDVNAYIHEISAQDFTAKDFRTWSGTVLAARALADAVSPRSATHGRKQVAAAIASVAKRLGNTQSVCRKCYIHPRVIDEYVDGRTIGPARGNGTAGTTGLTHDERAVVRLLSERLRKTA